MYTAMQLQCDGVVAETYQGDPPPFIWTACENLYHSSFCSEHHLKSYSSINQDTHTWVSRQDGVIDAVILFQIKRHTVFVLNEVVVFSHADIINFSRFIFEKYTPIKIIQFKAIFQHREKLFIPHLAFSFSEDFILTLPCSSELWLQCLSKKMRSRLRYSLSRAQRRLPQLQFHTVLTSDIDPKLIQQILTMSRVKMQNKGKKFCMSEREERYLISLMKKCGAIYLLVNEGEIIAGLLCTVCQQDLFFHVISHDADFDDIRAGLLCCYHTILLAIDNKCERIHFLWGRYQYKLQLGAKEEKLIKLAIFRSHVDKFIYPSFYLKKFFHQLKIFIQYSRQKFIHN